MQNNHQHNAGQNKHTVVNRLSNQHQCTQTLLLLLRALLAASQTRLTSTHRQRQPAARHMVHPSMDQLQSPHK
jgi:hypothetical protein